MLLLIDGSNLAHRALHATYSDLGYYCKENAIVNFIKRLSSIVDKYRLEYGVIVAWDRGIPDFRRKIYPEYKANYATADSVNLVESLIPEKEVTRGTPEFTECYSYIVRVLSEEILPKCKCMSLRVSGVEADDIIAYICNKTKGTEKVIISSDKDMLQLIDESTSVYSFNSSTNKLCDYEWACMNYDPKWFREQFLLEKAILGDGSDNINGIDKVGNKNAKIYAEAIIRSRKLGSSLVEALHFLERPKRASQAGLTNIKDGIEIIKRNIDLMDLYYPIMSKLDMVNSISKAINIYSHIEIEYNQSMDVLETIPDLAFGKCFTSLDKIFEANCTYDPKIIIKRC